MNFKSCSVLVNQFNVVLIQKNFTLSLGLKKKKKKEKSNTPLSLLSHGTVNGMTSEDIQLLF